MEENARGEGGGVRERECGSVSRKERKGARKRKENKVSSNRVKEYRISRVIR